MAQISIKLSVHFAWWVMPLAQIVARTLRPFMGKERAIEVASNVALMGVKVTATEAVSA